MDIFYIIYYFFRLHILHYLCDREKVLFHLVIEYILHLEEFLVWDILFASKTLQIIICIIV
jgi:hypothetical protein